MDKETALEIARELDRRALLHDSRADCALTEQELSATVEAILNARVHRVDDALVEEIRARLKILRESGLTSPRCTSPPSVLEDAEYLLLLFLQLSSSELVPLKDGGAQKEFTIQDAARVVYRKYGANLSAFWRDAFAAEAQRRGRTEVEQYNVDGNCVHCIPICRKCRLNTIEAHLKEKEQIRATTPTESSERRCGEVWVDAQGHSWERRAAVDSVQCPLCLFTFDAAHTDGDSGGYSCPNCEGCPSVG